jgi:hypothetical protein
VPCRVHETKRHGWRTRHQSAASLGVGDAFGLSGAKPDDAVQPQHKRVGERLGAEGEVSGARTSRSRVNGPQGCSLTTSWLQRSGERHLVTVGSSAGASQDVRVGGNGGDEPAVASHHLDQAGSCAWAVRVFQLRDRGFTFSTRSYSRPERVGIPPIEDILGREVVSSNRRAANRSWQVRSNARLQQRRAAASGGGSPGGEPCGRQGVSKSAVEGQAPPAERRSESAASESRAATDHTQRKLSRRKTASLW